MTTILAQDRYRDYVDICLLSIWCSKLKVYQLVYSFKLVETDMINVCLWTYSATNFLVSSRLNLLKEKEDASDEWMFIISLFLANTNKILLLGLKKQLLGFK